MADLIAGGFSWAKVLYSGILIGIIALLAGELHRLWFDRTLHVGTFQFFENGEEKPALGRAFAVQVLNYHRTLSHFLQQEASRRRGTPEAGRRSPASPQPQAQPSQESTWWPREVFPVSDPKSALSDVELSVQGINVKQILTALRQWVSTPNEIYGVVEKGATVVRGTASWPNGPSRARGDLVDGQLIEIKGQADTSPAAFQVACGLVWAQAARRQQDLADVTSSEFCDWAQAWSEFLGLRDKAARVEGLTPADVDRVTQLHAFLTRLIERAPVYPEIYRLRADLTELLPAAQKTENALAQAQDDRTTYNIRTDPEKRKLPREIVKFVALVEARPAIPIRPDGVAPVSDTWRSVLAPYDAAIAATAKATGFLRIRALTGGPAREASSAFAVAPGIIATAGFILPDPIRQGPFPHRLEGAFQIEFSFADRGTLADALEASTAVEEVLFATKKRGADAYFALLRLARHDTSAHPPLKLQRAREALQNSVGRYVFSVGYPAEDRKVPPPFLERLLGGQYLIKRMMPGRVVSIGPIDMGEATPDNVKPASGVVRAIQSDVSSAPGLSGAPLVDLRTGEVIGLHYGGRWEEGKGKFAYAYSMADMLALPNLPDTVRPALGLVARELE